MAEVGSSVVNFSGDFRGTATNAIRIIGDSYPVIAVSALVAQIHLGVREIHLRGYYGGIGILSAGLHNNFFWEMRYGYDDDLQCYVFTLT